MNSGWYVNMFNDFFFPILNDLGINNSSVYFQQDGGTPPTAHNTMGVPISRLILCNILLWGSLKFKLLQTWHRNLHELQQRIPEEVQAFPADMLQKVSYGFPRESKSARKMEATIC